MLQVVKMAEHSMPVKDIASILSGQLKNKPYTIFFDPC
jgi:hypothetical protein